VGDGVGMREELPAQRAPVKEQRTRALTPFYRRFAPVAGAIRFAVEGLARLDELGRGRRSGISISTASNSFIPEQRVSSRAGPQQCELRPLSVTVRPRPLAPLRD
jgi:hypothetical protein